MSTSQHANKRHSQPSWKTYFLKTPYRVITHPNFLTLTAKTQMVLFDIHRQIQRWTNFGVEQLPAQGFPYSYGHAIIDMHRNTFAKSIETLIDRGWIEEALMLDSDSEVRWYHPSAEWLLWEPDEKLSKRITALQTKIKRRELADRLPTCTIFVHPPAQKNSNPALNFWAETPQSANKKCAPLPLDQIQRLGERADARSLSFEKEEPPPLRGEVSEKELETISEAMDRIRANARAHGWIPPEERTEDD